MALEKTMDIPASSSGPDPGHPAGASPPATAQAMPTPAIILAMLATSPQVSDLIFSPGRAPQVELHGQLMEVNIPGLGALTPQEIGRAHV